MSQNPLTRTRPGRRPARIARRSDGARRRPQRVRAAELDIFGPDGPSLDEALRIALGLAWMRR